MAEQFVTWIPVKNVFKICWNVSHSLYMPLLVFPSTITFSAQNDITEILGK